MNSDLNDLENSSVKSETFSNESTIDQSQAMTISEEKPHLDLLGNLLASDPQSSTSSNQLDTGLLLEKVISQMRQSTGEQPLDLSLSSNSPRKDLNLNEVFASFYPNNDSLAGKIKK